MRDHSTTNPHIRYLLSLNACSDAVEWSSHYPTLAVAWDVCQRGDWMLWLAIRSGAYGEPWSDRRRPLVAACIACARAVRHPAATLAHLDAMERWCRGEASEQDARAALGALYAASTSAAAYAAYAAAAAAAAAYAAYAAAAAAAMARCADIVRAMLPCPEVP